MSLRIRELPPLRHSIEIETPNGLFYRWADDAHRTENVPTGLRHSSTSPGGYESLDVTLPRKHGSNYPDLERLSTIRVRDASGTIVNECRLERAPRVSGNQASISPSAVGFQAALEDNKNVKALIIDRELNKWEGNSRQRRIDLGTNYNPQYDPEVVSDPATGLPGIRQDGSGIISGSSGMINEAHYDAGAGVLIGAVQFQGTAHDTAGGSTWSSVLFAANDDTFGSGTTVIASDNNGASRALAYWTFATPQRVALHQLRYQAPYAGDGKREYFLTNVAVIGDHGLTVRGTAPEIGFYASDIVRYIVSTFAPSLTIGPDSIQPSDFIVPQMSFLDPTTAGECIRQATRFGLEDWGVWEDKTFWWHPRSMYYQTWRARIAPAQLEETGPQADRLWNSVIVQFTDPDGSTRTVGPIGSGSDTESDLLNDPDPENPANKLGLIRRDMLVMGIATPNSAIQIGQRFLTEQKLLDSSGRAQLIGHVEDDHGVLHPYSHVRAGDAIVFVDGFDQSYRRIVKVEHNHDTRTASVDIDAPPEGLQSLLERLGVSLVSLGL